MYSVREIKIDRAMITTWNSQWNLEKNTVQCSVLWIYPSGAHTVRFSARMFGSGFEELHTSVTGHSIFHLLSPRCNNFSHSSLHCGCLGAFELCNIHAQWHWTQGISNICTREGIKPVFNPVWRDRNQWVCSQVCKAASLALFPG